ncbi:hypothetical protein [Pseudonocardia spirodelae]|uniref:Uncharacterized protein n=1 Tax=Pseudonocardia spirodelae TaxID=3133431 RepID=A0ABU8T0C6_9PSEU
MPDESDTALLHVQRGLVRADDSPPDLAAQRRAHGSTRIARWARWLPPAVLAALVVAAVLPGVGGAGFWLLAVLAVLAAVVVAVLAARAAVVAQAAAGLPVPIEITGKVATAMRAVLAVTGALRSRRAGGAGEGVAVVREWTRATGDLRAAWLRGDVGAWHDHARALVAVGERAARLRAASEPDPPR